MNLLLLNTNKCNSIHKQPENKPEQKHCLELKVCILKFFKYWAQLFKTNDVVS